MGDVQQVACTPSGECKFLFTNTINGKNGFVRLPAGPTPPMQVGTAGYGFQIISHAGAVLLNVSETGAFTPGSLGVPVLLADPVAGPPQIYVLGGQLKFWDGATAADIVTAP